MFIAVILLFSCLWQSPLLSMEIPDFKEPTFFLQNHKDDEFIRFTKTNHNHFKIFKIIETTAKQFLPSGPHGEYLPTPYTLQGMRLLYVRDKKKNFARLNLTTPWGEFMLATTENKSASYIEIYQLLNQLKNILSVEKSTHSFMDLDNFIIRGTPKIQLPPANTGISFNLLLSGYRANMLNILYDYYNHREIIKNKKSSDLKFTKKLVKAYKKHGKIPTKMSAPTNCEIAQHETEIIEKNLVELLEKYQQHRQAIKQ